MSKRVWTLQIGILSLSTEASLYHPIITGLFVLVPLTFLLQFSVRACNLLVT